VRSHKWFEASVELIEAQFTELGVHGATSTNEYSLFVVNGKQRIYCSLWGRESI
jgi:hypothetical protein